MTIRGENGEVIPIEKNRLKKANYSERIGRKVMGL